MLSFGKHLFFTKTKIKESYKFAVNSIKTNNYIRIIIIFI